MVEHTIAAVIPLFNKERFIGRAITSALDQTRPVDEIFIVDDASTDGSRERVKGFIDSRVTLLRRSQPGPGGYAARNLAIRSATSQWIAFLDADDSWKPDFAQELSRLIGSAPNEVGCVFTGHEKVLRAGLITRDPYSLRYARDGIRFLDFDHFVSVWLQLGMSPIWTSACAIRRDILLEAGLFPEGRCRLGGDKDTWLRVMARTDALSSPRVLATYHTVTQNQVTREENFNTRPCLVNSVEQMISEADGDRRHLLMRLHNREVFEQGLTVPPHERVSGEIYQGFFVSLNPVWYVTLLALTYLPYPLRNLLHGLVLRGRRLWRRITRKYGEGKGDCAYADLPSNQGIC